jgi:protein required for attachment to host cells
VLLANASRARLLERDPDNGALRELQDFVHTPSRMKGYELRRDRAGTGQKGSSRAPFEPPTQPGEKEERQFAQQLAQHLESAAHAQQLPAWALYASSPFLGRLRSALSAGASAQLAQHGTCDLSTSPLHELEPRLRAMLPPGAAPS